MLTEVDLTLARAIELAVGMEAVEKNAKSLEGMESAIKSITPAKACHIDVDEHHTNQKTADSKIPNATIVENTVTKHLSVDLPKETTITPTKFEENSSRNEVCHICRGQSPSVSGKRSVFTTLHRGSSYHSPYPGASHCHSRSMELDTGAVVTIVSKRTYDDLFPNLPTRENHCL